MNFSTNIFGLFLLAFLSSCYAPPQHFNEGTEHYNMANPKILMSEQQLGLHRSKHNVLIAVLDGGVDYNNKYLQKNLQYFSKNNIGFDILGDDYFPSYKIVDAQKNEEISEDLDAKEHGTHVSTLATLDGIFKNDNGEKEKYSEYLGLLPIRVLPFSSDLPSPTESEDANLCLHLVDILNKAIKLSAEEKVQVINMSIGADFSKLPDAHIEKVANELNSKLIIPIKNEWKDILFVVAAGNEKKKLTNYLMSIPATLKSDNLISVGALKDKNHVASFSNYGELVDVFIRGEDVNSDIPDNIRKKLSGTSMASPLVANLAAKMKILNNNLSAVQIKKIILETADQQELEVASAEESKPVEGQLQVKVVNFKKALEEARRYKTK